MLILHFLTGKIYRFFWQLGEVTLLIITAAKHACKQKIHAQNTVEQMMAIGVKSLPITIVTAVFVGMAFSVQVVREFLKFGAVKMIGGVVGLAMWRELGPLLTAVVLAGRVGAAITAEIGTMKVTEQVEALEAMSQDPIDYLVIPRIIACTVMMPLLVGVADIAGFFGGLLVALGSQRINIYAYFYSAQTMLTVHDIMGGLIKAVLFGFSIGVISCYMGLHATAGAKGVGEITTKSVVVSLVSIFIFNYFLSLALY